MKKQAIPTEMALEVVLKTSFKAIKAKYGEKLDDNIFIGFLNNQVLHFLTLNIKATRYKEVEKLMDEYGLVLPDKN